MNNSPDDFETELVARFRQEHRHVPDDPFIGATARRIRAARRRRNFSRHALQVAGVAVLVLGSHWLIEASVIASRNLDAWFADGFDWFVTPLGTIAVLAGIACVVVTAIRWRSHRGA
jgi:predicted phage tail protein